MRRNNFPRIHSTPASQNGPLMTDHIELRDLDLELELLKRKREMIEKQQQQYANNQQFNNHQRQYNFNKPSQMFQVQQQQHQFNPNQNFSQNFGQSTPQPFNHYDGGQSSLLGKRPNETKWHPNSAPKRFSGPTGGSSHKKFGAGPSRRSDPSLDKPTPLMKIQVPNRNQFSQPKTPNLQVQPWNKLPFYVGAKSVPPSQRFNSSKAKPTNRDFKPTKVTKPKAASANMANKLVSYPIPNQKSPKRPLVASKDASKLVNKVDEPVESFILHADKVPTQQIAGRLELALGNILKDIKSKYGEDDLYKASFLSHAFMREVKQAIRERLRTVMIGKHVGKVGIIVEEYRKVFPVESDSEIVKVALEAKKAANNNLLAIKIEDKDSPEHYFKVNLNRLLNTALDDMFKKLQQLYGGDTKTAFTSLYDILEISKDMNKDIDDAEIEENPEVPESEQNTKEGKGEGENEIQEEIKGNDNENVSKEETDENESKIESESEEKATERKSPKYETRNRIKRMDHMLTAYVKRKLALLLPKFRTTIIKTLVANDQYMTTRELILTKLQDKLSIECRMEAAAKASAPEKSPEKATSSTSPPSTPASASASTMAPPLPYYVKIHGRPILPKKKQMQTFLQQFKPKSIKKHRHMQLLFVGFDDKEDFEKMVAVKETEIGQTKIYIKVSELSEKAVNGSQNESLNLSTVSGDDDVQLISEEKSENESINLINSDLDDQINDLLSSIRKDEETQDPSETDPNIDNVPGKSEGETVEKDATKEDVDNLPGENEVSKPDENVDSKSNEIENGQSEAEKPANSDGNGDEASADVKKNEIETEKSLEKTDNEEADRVEALKSDIKSSGRATPTRSSARIQSTPSSIRTRRASRLAQE